MLHLKARSGVTARNTVPRSVRVRLRCTRVEAQRREDAALNEIAGIRHAIGVFDDSYAESVL